MAHNDRNFAINAFLFRQGIEYLDRRPLTVISAVKYRALTALIEIVDDLVTGRKRRPDYINLMRRMWHHALHLGRDGNICRTEP